MTLFSALRATKVLRLAVALTVGGMMTANAGDRQLGTGWSGNDGSSRTIIRREQHEHRGWRPRDKHRYDDRRAERRRYHHSRFAKLRQMEPGYRGGWLGTQLRSGNGRSGYERGNGGTYVGAITAYGGYGNDTYFYVDGDNGTDWYELPPKRRISGPKVITVTPDQNSCSWEAGVCVIRPGS